MTTFTVSTSLTTINCGECGGTYAIQERYRQEKERAAGTWHCPYCRTGWGYHETEEAKLRKQLAREEARRADAEGRVSRERELRERTERQLTATRGVVTRTKKRIAGGACPCCNRSFVDLHRHMNTKHPDYAKAQAAAAR